MGMLCLLLHRMGKPLHFVAVYWWNPVVIKETANSAHMDALVLPFVLISMLYALQNRSVRSGLFLALAACVKIWPAILAFTMIRAIHSSAKRIALACTLSLAVVAILSLPMIPALRLGERSGFFAYGQEWEMNDALFMIFHKGVEWTALALGYAPGSDAAGFTARLVVFCVLMAWVAVVSVKRVAGPEDLANRLVLILGALFMLSPTQFPWYYVWVVPFLALSPRPSLLVLTAMLPLYYLKFHFSARENVDLFHNGIVWIEYAPTFVLILWEGRKAMLGRRAGAGA